MPELRSSGSIDSRSFENDILRLRLACNGLEALMRTKQWGKAERQNASGIAEFLTSELPDILSANEKRFRRSLRRGEGRRMSLSLILEDHDRLRDLAGSAAEAIVRQGRSGRQTESDGWREPITRYVAAQRYYLSNAASITRDQEV